MAKTVSFCSLWIAATFSMPFASHVRADETLDNLSLTEVSVPANDVVYDPFRDLLYATIPSAAGAPYGNSIATISPSDGSVLDHVFIGSEPTQLAISDDGSRVYAGLSGARAVRYWEPGTGDVGPLRKIDSSFGPAVIENLAVPPGQPNVVLISKDAIGNTFSGEFELLGDDWSSSPNTVWASANHFGFVDEDTIISFNDSDTSFATKRWSLNGRNLRIVDEQSGIVSFFNIEAEVKDDIIYYTDGTVADSNTLSANGAYDLDSMNKLTTGVEAVPIGFTYFIGETWESQRPLVAKVFDTETYLELDSAELPTSENGDVSELTIAGQNRLAFVLDRFDQPGSLFILNSVPVSNSPDGDFDSNGIYTVHDIDALMTAIATESSDLDFDLDGDGVLGDGDRDAWLGIAGEALGFAGPLLVGDTDLDGDVDTVDLNNMALSWRTGRVEWTNGNFTGRNTDASDLNLLALNWRASVPMAAPVPESTGMPTLYGAILFLVSLRRRRL